MSLLSERRKAEGLFSISGLLLDVMTALLMAIAAAIVLVFLAAAMGMPPATELDFLAIAYS
jgi:hypothetical protein